MTKYIPMKQLSLSIAAVGMAMLAASCGQPTSQGQLVGDYSNKTAYTEPAPLGMTKVPTGYMKSGYSDEDIKGSMDAPVRTFNMIGFYMDATEITNAQYRQYVNWVRDSIAHVMLGHVEADDNGVDKIVWKEKINWKDTDVQDQLMTMFIDASMNPLGYKMLDVKQLNYTYKKYDHVMHAKNPSAPASQYVYQKNINIYPDTAVWLRQFSYSNNEPIAKQYFNFQAFDEYPVVGVNWHQANAFCNWRTQLWKDERTARKQFFEGEFQLPSEMEWEWAARGGRDLSPYPWGGPYVINQKGCYLANFKPGRGDYSADGGLYTVKAKAYWPNDYGLYNMSGNVAEWTATPYVTNAYNDNLYSDLNPDVLQRISENDASWQKLVVVKGGSWRDSKQYLNISNRDREYADTAKAHIGFRTMIRYISSSLTNK